MRHREKCRTTFLYVSFTLFQNGVDFFPYGGDFFEYGAAGLQKVNAIFPCGAVLFGSVAPVAFSVARNFDENAPVSNLKSTNYPSQ